MVKNILSVLLFLFSVSFFFLVVSTYLSENQKKNIMKNREMISEKIKKNMTELPVLSNNTNNVIEFNSGYENESNKIERNFWRLFKK
jgi:hypothetical protein|tara:strand:- start:191 stop:451 length:261 start_codon:yes stop_codon:yes gene_type:complete